MRFAVLLLACNLQLIPTAASEDTLQLFRRSFLGLGGSNNSSTTPSTPSGPSANTNSCQILPFSPETWNKLNLDHYLETYPGGRNLSVTAYAESKGAINFDCGIGNICYAGQPCSPIPLPDWYVLFAVQQWNAQRNALNKAVSFGINFIEGTVTSLLALFFPAIDPFKMDQVKLTFGVNGGLAMASNTILLDIFAMFNSFQFGWNLFFNELNNLLAAAMDGVVAFLPDAPEPLRDAFEVWSHISEGLSQYGKSLRIAVAKQTDAILKAGISSPDGIMGHFKNGSYLAPMEPVYLPVVGEQLKNVTTVLFLVRILRAMDAFVTVGSEPCHGKGKNGALEGDNVLSYCDPTGTMFNIVRVGEGKHKGKEDAKIISGASIETEFGITTQYLTNASLACQTKFGGFEHFPYTNSTIPKEISALCVCNLPVCDLRNETLKGIKERHGVLEACRKGGLPI